MTDYIRRVVSGNKARFKDDILGLELDLVYVTDEVIIMGYPASGIEGLYRNRREDAVKFLKHRHGNNFWVFNFCPVKENSYEADVFEGRVSRYPFPDHHAPPLAMMPLVAREMNTWLKGSHDRVAVLHCKAGKGRSGTMACAYLLSLDHSPMPPRLERSYSVKQWAKRRMETAVDSLPHDDTLSPPHSTATLSLLLEKHAPSDTDGILDVDSGAVPPRLPTPNREKSFTDALKGVLDLHTARRMKSSSEKDGEEKVKHGVSIPSQRRFLYYWTLFLAHEAPKHMWAVDSSGSLFQRSKVPNPKVRLTKLTVRMHETSTVKMGIVRAANKVIEKTYLAKGPVATASFGSSLDSSNESSSSSPVWASLARYDDTLVDLLEQWEVYTRDPGGHMGKRRVGSEHLTPEGSTKEEEISRIFENGKWDKEKMVRRFAQLGVVSKSDEKTVDRNGDKIKVYTLRPLSKKLWEGLKHELDKTGASGNQAEQQDSLKQIEETAQKAGISRSEANSTYDLTSTTTPAVKGAEVSLPGLNLDDGVVLDAGREIRIKLYMGQVSMGWLWFVPTFHMPQPPPSPGPLPSSSTTAPIKTTFLLTRKDLDFPLGLGSAIIDVEIAMEWVVPLAAGVPMQRPPSG